MPGRRTRFPETRDGKRAIFLFSSSEDADTVQRIRARMRRLDGSFSPADIVSVENGLPVGLPRLSVNAGGQAAATSRQQSDDKGGDLIWVGANFLQ